MVIYGYNMADTSQIRVLTFMFFDKKNCIHLLLNLKVLNMLGGSTIFGEL